MIEPARAVARPPIGSENNLPTWTREGLQSLAFNLWLLGTFKRSPP